MNARTGLKVTAIACAVVLIGGGCSRSSNSSTLHETTPSSTRSGTSELRDDETWAEFKDNQYHFAFSYPRAYEQDDDCRATSLGESENLDVTIGNTIDITVEDFTGKNINSYLEENFKGGTDARIEEKQSIHISSGDAIKVAYRFGGINRFGENVYIVKNNKLYTVAFHSGAFTCSARHPEFFEPDVFKTIYSTFTFNS